MIGVLLTVVAQFFLSCPGLFALPPAPGEPGPNFYVIPENNFVADLLDSVVAPVEVVDTATELKEGVFSLDFQDLNMTYYQTLGDIVRFFPGTAVNSYGPFGNRESVRLFNQNPAQTAILVNGSPIGYADYLGLNTYALPVQNIKRIEVVPFAGALEYGLASSGGAINLVTRGFSQVMPFYQFSSLTETAFKEQLGDLHFAQRIYRNINIYFSSLLKKNTDPAIGYSAVQFNIKLDCYLKNNWNASLYTYSNSDQEQVPELDLSTTNPLPIIKQQSPNNKFNLLQFTLDGQPYRQNKTRVDFYRSTNDRTSKGLAPLGWSNWGLDVRQELFNLWENQKLTAGCSFRSDAFSATQYDSLGGVQQVDTLNKSNAVSEFTMRLTDQTQVFGLLDAEAALNLSKFSSDNAMQLLPAAGLYYRKLKNTSFYLSAERTYRPPNAIESSLYLDSLASAFAYYVSNGSARQTPAPEEGYTASLGTQYALNRDWYFNGGFFYRNVHNAIYWNWPDTITQGQHTVITLGNRDETTPGIYGQAKFNAWKNHVNGCLNYTHLLDNNIPGLGMVPALPDDHLSGFVRGHVSIKPEQLMDLGLVVAGEWTGPQKKWAGNGSGAPFPDESVLDISIFYNYLYIKTYVTIKNILHTQTETQADQTLRNFFGFPPRPLNYQFGVSLELGGIYDTPSTEDEP